MNAITPTGKTTARERKRKRRKGFALRHFQREQAVTESSELNAPKNEISTDIAPKRKCVMEEKETSHSSCIMRRSTVTTSTSTAGGEKMDGQR